MTRRGSGGPERELATDIPTPAGPAPGTPEDDVERILAALRAGQASLGRLILRDLEKARGSAVRVRVVLEAHRPALEALLAGSAVAGALEGMRRLVEIPEAAPDGTPGGTTPGREPPPALDALDSAAVHPKLLPLVEAAARRLSGAGVLTQGQLAELVAQHRRSAAALAGVALEETHAAVIEALGPAVLGGGSLRKFRAAVRRVLGAEGFLSDRELEGAFRTGVMAAYSDGQADLVQNNPLAADLFPYAAYHATHDDRVRKEHKALERLGLDGTNVYRVDDPTWRRFRPPWGFNCLLPGNVVEGAFAGAIKSWYDGEVVEITTRSGQRTTVTANHPVLTPQGFVPARMLQQGDHAVRHQGCVEGGERSDGREESAVGAVRPHEAGVAPPDEDEQNAPASAEQVFRALLEMGHLAEVPTRPDDLHGDAARGDGHVEVVGPLGKLLLDADATLAQGVGDVRLAPVNEPLPGVAGAGRRRQSLGGSLAASRRPVGRGDLPAPLLGRHPRPLRLLRFGLAAHLNASRYESALEHVSGDACLATQRQEGLTFLVAAGEVVEVGNLDAEGGESSASPVAEGLPAADLRAGPGEGVAQADYADPGFAGELLQRFPGVVLLDEIVDIRKHQWRGHVYDFQSPGGWLVSDNLIVSNCRCTWTPTTVEGAARAGVREAKEWLETGVPPARPEWVAPPPFEPPAAFERTLAADAAGPWALLAVELATRAPKGGCTIQGKAFKGGQFIPTAVLETATPEEKAVLEAAKKRKGTPAPKQKTPQEKLQAGKPVESSEHAAESSDAAVEAVAYEEAERLRRSVERLGGIVKVPDLYDAVAARVPGLTLEKFHKLLLRWAGEDKLQLQLCNDPRLEPRAGEGIHSPRGLLHYVRWKAKPATPAPKPAAPARAEPAAADSTSAEPGRVLEVSPDDLAVDAARFQFKLNTDAAGVTEELKKVRVWNPDFAGVISVWRDPADGRVYVVNGHHRHELARRLGAKRLAVRFIQAGSAREARAVGALVNIAEGRGTAIDAAKFLRDTGLTVADIEARGVSVAGKLAADAAALARLGDRHFDRLARGLLDEATALAVARHLPDESLQNQLFSLLEKMEAAGKDPTPRVVEEMAREMAATPTRGKKEASLFGDIESEESLFVERAELKAHVRAELAREANDFAAVASKRRAGRVAEVEGNALNVAANKEHAALAAQARGTYATLVNRKGPISDAINAAAKKYAEAGSRRERDAAKKEAVEAVRAAIEQEAGGGTADGAGAGGGAGGGGAAAGGGGQDAGRRGGADDAGREAPAPARLSAALKRYDERGSLPAAPGGGLFGGDDARSREHFGRLPEGTEVVLTEGRFRGRAGRIRHEQALDGSRRVVVQLDGEEGTTPVAHDAVEPLDDKLSWRTALGASGRRQGGMFADQEYSRKEPSEAERSVSAVAADLGKLSRAGGKGTVRGHPVEAVGIGRYRVTIKGQALDGDLKDVAGWIAAAGEPANGDAEGTEMAWEPDPKYKGKLRKWVGTGDDAGKRPRYQHKQPGTGRKKAAAPAADKPTPAPQPAGKTLYSGVVLDAESRGRLLAALKPFIPAGWKVVAHHMTHAFGKDLPEGLRGKRGNLKATHVAYDEALGVLAVRVESDIPSENATPHITIAVAPHGKAARSNKLTNWVPLRQPVELTGTAENVAAQEKPAAAKEPWAMTAQEFEAAPVPPSFGDWVVTEDGRFGYIQGGGGLGSDRVKVYGADGQSSWHSKGDLKLVRAGGANRNRHTESADAWLADVGGKVEELRTRHQGLLLKKALTDRFRAALESGRVSRELYDRKVREGDILGDDGYEQARRAEEEIEAARSATLKVKDNGVHRALVLAALAAGKPVPAEVLADYPDLAEKYAKKPAQPAQATPANTGGTLAKPAAKPTEKPAVPKRVQRDAAEAQRIAAGMREEAARQRKAGESRKADSLERMAAEREGKARRALAGEAVEFATRKPSRRATRRTR